MEKSISFVTFKISNELYGVNINATREVIQLCEITSIPNAPAFIDGVINLRGEIIPVVDLYKRFNFQKKEFSEDEELLRSILILNVKDLTIGVMIDKISKVMIIEQEGIEPQPSVISGVGIEYVLGVVKLHDNLDNLLIILDEKKLFSKEELLQIAV